MDEPRIKKQKSLNVLLSVNEMYRADALATASGISGIDLMDCAGAAVADVLRTRWHKQQGKSAVVVLCGPGNNGGDGFVAARYLCQAGWSVRLHLLGSMDDLHGDAAHQARKWSDETADTVRSMDGVSFDDRPIVVDALFGAGLKRPIEGDIAVLFARFENETTGCISIDLPSGVAGNSGAVMGHAPRADVTVTFFRKKPAHLLLPGAELAGTVIVADIGTPPDVLNEIAPKTYENGPQLWQQGFLIPKADSHKYTRGHLLIMGGARMTGAARLAARAARRMGAGLSSIVSRPESFEIYAAGDPGTIIETAANVSDFEALLADERRNAVVIGPGAGIDVRTCEFVLASLKVEKSVVLDADALSAFRDRTDDLFNAIHSGAKQQCVLTPHAAEFTRLFPALAAQYPDDKLLRARAAATLSGAVVLLKGADTVIAAPDGHAAINVNAPPDLATAGAGDVLAGIIGGLLAQGMNGFEAACAGAWIHGALANEIGAGLIAEDLCEAIPVVLRRLHKQFEAV